MNLRSLTLAILMHGSTLTLLGEPHVTTVTRTFYVSGIECGGCVYLVQQALSEAKGLKAEEIVPSADNHVNVTFDPRCLSEHQVAQVVREVLPLHGAPYLATLRLRFEELDRDWPLVDLVMERWRGRVRTEIMDWEKGTVALHFDPLNAGAKNSMEVGWSLVAFRKALEEKAGSGRPVKFQVVEEKPHAS